MVMFVLEKLPFNLTVHQHPGLHILSVLIIWVGAMCEVQFEYKD